MNNTISKNLMSSIRHTGICFLALAAFGISSAYAQEAQQDEETVKVRKVKKTASDYETRVVKGMNRYSTLTEKDSTYEVKIPNIVTYGDKEYRVTNIGENAFYNCSGLESVTIPNSVTSIGNSAFEGTAWFNNQPDGLVYAGKVAYKYKGTMPTGTHITLEEGTLGITNYAFYGCSGLTSVTIPNSVTSIGDYAFRDCSGLTSVTIGNSVTSIGNWAFYGCSGLTSVTCHAMNVPTIGNSCFYGVPLSTATLYVPASAVNAYKSTSPWSDFGTILPVAEPTYIVGDANGNGEVEIGDVTSVLTLMATPDATGYDNKAADANGNGEIEIGDVTTILTIMAGN